jgi:hypothetical protein
MVNSNSQKDKGMYVLPEVLPLSLCGAVLTIVLEENDKAKLIFEQIKENCKLPGCQEAFKKFENDLPKGQKIIRDVIKSAGYNIKKPPSREINQLKIGKDFIFGTKKLIENYTRKFTPWVKSNTQRNNDFQEVVASINDFIKVGFNREHEKVKGKYKVTALSSKALPLAVIMKAYLEVKPMNLKRYEQAPMYLHGKKLYTVKSVTTGRIPRRVQKALNKDFIGAGFKLKHDDKLDREARWWYECRVVHSGPEEFCRELALKGEILDPANVSKEIKEYDEAIGYPREKTGKRKI